MEQPLSPAGADVGRPTIDDIVRDVIAAIAPDELPIAEAIRHLDPDIVRCRLHRRRQPREPIGFGLGVIVPLMTSVAWIALDEVLRHGVDGASGSQMRRLRQWLRNALRRVLRKPAFEVTVPPLPPAQLAAIKSKVLELSPAFDLPDEQAEALAERLVARLVLSAAKCDPEDAIGQQEARGSAGPTATP